MVKFEAVAAPWFTFTTCLITLMCAGWSWFVTVQVVVVLTTAVPVQFAEKLTTYPVWEISETEYAPGASVTFTPSAFPLKEPGVTLVPVTLITKSIAVRVPPLVLLTFFMTRR